MKNRLSNLKDVMSIQTTSYNVKLMNRYIEDFVKKVPNCKIYKNHGNLYVTRGTSDLYPCVVAHTDTVHDIHKKFVVQEYEDVLYAINERYERVGVGGDDKVGVFVALEILRTNPVCKVAFFRDEEVGCQGSKVADMKFFDDVSLVLQCDRQGYSDFVSSIFQTELYNQDFSDKISDLLLKYDRVESDGGMTDVWQLTENGLSVACANMSCGYYDPHSDNEYIIISEVFRTLDFVEELIEELSYKKWSVTYAERNKYSSSYYNRHNYVNGYRRFGGGREDDIFEEDNYNRNDWKDDYVVPEASCTQCDSHGEVCYDDTVHMYWCFGCQDYVREEMLEFSDDLPKDEEDLEEEYVDEFLKQIEESQRKIDNKK